MSRHFTRRERRMARRLARELSKARSLTLQTARQRKRFVRMNWRTVAGEKLEG